MHNLFRITLIAALVAGIAMPLEASIGLGRKAAQEVVEHLVRTGGSKAAREIAEFGGEQAVREVLRRAAQEGGEAMARQTALLVRTHGVSALRAVRNSPALMVRNLNALPESMVGRAIAAINHHPAAMQSLVARYGDDALRVAARHPGVGQNVAETLGREGISTALRLQTPQAIQLNRLAPAIREVPANQRGQVLEMIGRAPERILGLLERHPKVLYTSAGVGVLLAYKENLVGGDELVQNPDGTWEVVQKSGMVGRTASNLFDMTAVHYGLIGLFSLLGVFLAGKATISLVAQWRLARIRERNLEKGTVG